jgi:4-hydroxy-tetrahydrodipicolinate reductase
MNIALIGYGSMGKMLHTCAVSRNHTVPIIIDSHHQTATAKRLESSHLEKIDTVIDFSGPKETLQHIKLCKQTSTNIVIGTTGIENSIAQIQSEMKNSSSAAMWSSNFSIGVNIYYNIIQKAAELVNNFDEYDIWGHEIHHNNKEDSPSGTAKTLEEILLSTIERKTEMLEQTAKGKIKPNQLHFTSTRAGSVNFSHTIGLDSAADTITIQHTARNREGYALGAIQAAEWLTNKTGYFQMKDFLQL